MGEESDDRRSSTKSGKVRLQAEVKRYAITSYKEYRDILNEIDDSKTVYIFYGGSISPTSGYTWCPICVEASQALEKRLVDASPDDIFISVHVGSQEEWEDKSNPFRTDKNINLRVVPTLVKYKNPRRLEGRYCLKPELVDLIFEQNYCEF